MFIPQTIPLVRSVLRWSVAGLIVISTTQAQTPKAALGDYHTLAVTQNGRIISTGANNYGQLGIGTTVGDASGVTYYRNPVEVVPDPTITPGDMFPVIAVAAGTDYSVALSANGKVWTWGRNNVGQLGLGNLLTQSYPRQVPINNPGAGIVGLPNPTVDPVVGIAAGAQHCLARTQSGKVYGWGLNTNGQLGNGALTNSSSPVFISTFSGGGVSYVSAGLAFSVAAYDGNVYTWGSNTYDQLGINAPAVVRSSVPIPVAGPALTGVTKVVAGGNHVLALVGNTLYAWGNNANRQSSSVVVSTIKLPTAYPGLSAGSILDVAAGDTHSLAVANVTGTSGWLYAWGANTNGQLGDGTVTARTTPVIIGSNGGPLGAYTACFASSFNSAAFFEAGPMKVWGDNAKGQLGSTLPGVAPADSHLPVFGITPHEITGEGVSTDFISIGYAYKPTGRNYVWGDGAGTMFYGYGTAPTRIDGPIINSVRTFPFEMYTAWLEYDGTITTRARAGAAGGNGGVQGSGGDFWYSTASKVSTQNAANSALPDVAKVAFGQFNAVALQKSGAVYNWGEGPAGAGGLGATTTAHTVATPVSGLTGIVDVACFGWATAAPVYYTGYAFASKSDGTVLQWGAPGTPAPVPGLTGVASLVSCWSNAAAVKSDGTVVYLDAAGATPVVGLTDVDKLAVGPGGHYIALHTDGGVSTWDYPSGTPVRQHGIGHARSVNAGWGVYQMTTDSGTLYAWGNNNKYQLGNGNNLPTPARVIVQGFDYRLNPSVDIDEDGIPDSWELYYFGNLNTTDGLSTEDYDGDGVSDFQEYLNGTDPTAP